MAQARALPRPLAPPAHRPQHCALHSYPCLRPLALRAQPARDLPPSPIAPADRQSRSSSLRRPNTPSNTDITRTKPPPEIRHPRALPLLDLFVRRRCRLQPHRPLSLRRVLDPMHRLWRRRRPPLHSQERGNPGQRSIGLLPGGGLSALTPTIRLKPIQRLPRGPKLASATGALIEPSAQPAQSLPAIVRVRR